MKKALLFVFAVFIVIETIAQTETQIGTTTYDLQTNGSVANRIIYNSDGTVQTAWTFSNELNASWTDRGTGYNYNNGTSWGAFPTARIEGATRTGWPEIVSLSNGSEVVIAHATGLGALVKSTRTTIGTGTWNSVQMSTLAPNSQIWPRAASGGSDGNTIHLIAHNDPTTTVNGVTGMIFYSRSLDGGATWDKQNIQLPGIDSSNYTYITGDEYAISANGNNVAVVYFGGLNRTVLAKSTDNGENWTSKVVLNIPFKYDPNSSNTTGNIIGISDANGDGVADTISTTDGSGAVIIDNNGTAHLYWGMMRLLDDTPGDGTWAYFPATNGLGYWNEDMGNIKPQFIARALDLDGSGVLIDNYPAIDIALYYSSLSSMPNAGLDANGCLYVVYSAVAETLNQGAQFYRHIYGIKSCDNGCTWSYPIDLTKNDDFGECVFPSIAHKVGAKFHFIYQKDPEPGLNIQGDLDPVALNQIMYVNENATRLDTVVGTCVAGILAPYTLFCSGDSILLKATCGTSWNWSTGATTQNIYAKTFGTISCAINTPCGVINDSVSLSSSSSAPSVILSSSASVACSGDPVTLSTNTVSNATWLWSTGDITQNIVVTNPGTYTVTVTNCGGSSSKSITIGNSPAPVASVSGTSSACPGDSVPLNANTGNGLTYLWSTGATTPSINALPGNYIVTVTNCSGNDTASITISSIPAPTSSITPFGNTSFCQGGNVVLFASGAGTGGTYMWSSGATSQNISVSTSGNYTVTAFNVCGDSAVSNATTVNVNPNPVPVVTPAGPITLCTGDTALLTASSASSYMWSTSQTTQNIIVSGAGNYTVTVTDANGCTGGSAIVNVTVSTSPAIPTITAGSATTFCQGGSVTLTSSAADNYLWSNGATTQTISVNSSGNYTVTAGSSCGNATSSATTVTVNSNPTATITPNGPTTFCTGNNVTLTATAANSYLWSGGQTTQAVTVSASGNYSVTITDANGCTSASAPTAVTVTATPTAVITAMGPTTFCQGGSVVLSGNQGTAYQWSSGQTTSTITVNQSGTFTVTITDAGGCSGSATSAPATVTVNSNPAAPTITAGGSTTFCQGGSVTLTSSGASSYNWSNGQTSQSITVFTAGNYSVTISDANGCTGSSSPTAVTVNSNPPTPTITASGATAFCQGGNVTLVSSSSSGNTWSNSANTQFINVDSSGDYSVTVTDGNGCLASSSATTVTVNPLPDATITANGATTFCEGASVMLISGSSSGNAWSTGQTTQFITVDSSATISLVVTDGNGCVDSSSQTITENSLPTANITASDSTTFCQGGSVDLTATSASSYLWSGSETTQTITVSSTGSFSVTITDANGCVGSSSPISVTVNSNPATPTITAGGATTFCDGDSVTLTSSATSGNKWNNGPTAQTISVDSSGSYSVTVTGGNGCAASSAATTITVNPVPNAAINVNDTAICNGESVNLIASGGASYLWNSGSVSNSITVAPASSSTYSVTVSNNFCSSSASIFIFVNSLPSTPFITQAGNNLACSVSGMSSYLWQLMGVTDTNCTTQFCVCSGNGFYTVEITDANGCSATSAPANISGCTTGTEENSLENEIVVYPNPSNGKFTIVISNSRFRISDLKIYNVIGEVVYQTSNIKHQTSNFDLSKQGSGIYYLQIRNENGTVNKKIIIE